MTAASRFLPALIASLALVDAVFAGPESGGPVVIVNAGSGVTAMSRDEVINIFLGRFRQLPSGLAARPLDLPVDHPDRERFYRLLVDKRPAEIRAYWARLVFSGRTSPPAAAAGEAAMLAEVARDRQAVGYLPKPPSDPRVRVVYLLEEPPQP